MANEKGGGIVAWRTVGTKRIYRRTIRCGDKFRTEYFAAGPEADLAAAIDAHRRAERQERIDASNDAVARWAESLSSATWKAHSHAKRKRLNAPTRTESTRNYYDCPISTGPLEGVNTKIQAMKRQAYGFRDLAFFKLKILAIHQSKYALVG